MFIWYPSKGSIETAKAKKGWFNPAIHPTVSRFANLNRESQAAVVRVNKRGGFVLAMWLLDCMTFKGR